MIEYHINATVVKTEKSKKKGTCPIRLYWSLEGKQYAVSARLTVLEEYWNQSDQTFNRFCPNRTSYITQLNNRVEVLSGLIDESLNSEGGFNFDAVKAQFKDICKEKSDGSAASNTPKNRVCKNLMDCIDEFIRIKKSTSHSTAKRMRLTKEKLLSYQSDINFQDFTEEFYVIFFRDNLETKLGLELGTIDGHISAVKTICNFASRYPNIHVPTDYKSYKRKKGYKEKITVSEAEANRIMTYEPKTKYESYVIDYFSVGYLTGLRFGDVQALRKEYFDFVDGQYYYDALSLKNKKHLRFPIRPQVVQILKKYDFNMVHIDITTMNRSIKKIAKNLGDSFLEKVRVRQETFDGIAFTYEFKYTLLSTHTSRHSFASHFMLRHGKIHGLNALKKLSQVLGHSSLEITSNVYWKIDSNKTDQLLLT